MARVTIENCIGGENKPKTKYELCVLASHIAHVISREAKNNFSINTEKSTIQSLRRIEAGDININNVKKSLQRSLIVEHENNISHIASGFDQVGMNKFFDNEIEKDSLDSESNEIDKGMFSSFNEE